MINISNYIFEKLKINKDINDISILDKVFKDVYELVDTLNIYFRYDLEKPIKVINSEVCFRPINSNSNDGVYVREHFVIEFKNSKTKIRFGCNMANDKLVMQFVYYNPNPRGKYAYGHMRNEDGYRFGKYNFLEWLKNPLRESLKRITYNQFKIEDE